MDLVAGAVGSIISKLGELLLGEYHLQKGLTEQIESLKHELESAHTALCKVGETPPEHLDPQVRLWAHEVREASYDMEDILDTVLVEVAATPTPQGNKDGLLQRLQEKIAKLFKKSKARHDIGSAIEEMKKRLQEVSDRRDRYSVPVAKPAPKTTVDRRLVDTQKDAAQIIGIDRTRAELKAKLSGHGDVSGGNSSKMMVLSIVGAGGLGKTTLVKAVYDELSPGYDCRAFISVGRNPDVVQVFTNIFFLLDEQKYKAIRDVKNLQLLIGELRKFLENKRYFIVIDDVWDVKSWDPLRLALDQKNNGSRVIKTTRNREVTCGDQVYQLAPLTHVNSKKLFYTRLFGGECPPNHPEEACEKILNKCGGVPLAIITMASLLVGKSEKDWLELCNSSGIYRGRDNRQVDDTVWVLCLSYHDLPCNLKTCLLYLSVYPEDFEIEKNDLIWKWVAEGFIEKKPGTGMFQRGEEYFHQLINRSMIQGVESKEHGIIDRCRVHDMVLDLIRGLAGEENFIAVSNDDGGTSSLQKVRRIAHQNRTLVIDQSHPDSHRDMAQLRTLAAHGCDIRGWVLHPSLKLLRVLALERCTTSTDPFAVNDWRGLELLGKLVHLRYLGLRGTSVRQFPEAIGALNLLQTLDLDGIGKYRMEVELSSSVCALTQLTCLRCDLFTKVPDGLLQKVTSLEELQLDVSLLPVESRRQFWKELGNLSKLRVLRVLSTGGLDPSMQAELLKSLCKLQELQHMDLHYYRRVSRFTIHNASVEWDTAALPERLRYLNIPRCIWFPRVPSVIHPMLLPNLCFLNLDVGDVDEAGLRALGGMPDLRYLCIQGSVGPKQAAVVVNIAAHDVFFQKLRFLYLHGWMVQSATNGDLTRVSFGYLRKGQDAEAEDCSRVAGPPQKKSRVEASPVVMPSLQRLVFNISVKDLYKDGHNILGLGFECLPSLRVVSANVDCKDAMADDLNKAEAEFRHLAQLLPTVIFEINKHNEDMMAQPIHKDNEESSEIQLAP